MYMRRGVTLCTSCFTVRFTSTETARHTIGTHQRSINVEAVRRRLASNTIHCRRSA